MVRPLLELLHPSFKPPSHSYVAMACLSILQPGKVDDISVYGSIPEAPVHISSNTERGINDRGRTFVYL
jgi:hypothetical protein